jgi:hypothetical protein
MEANTSNTANQGVRKESSKSPLAISRVHATSYQKEGTLTAEVKQTVTNKSYYPSKSVSNNMQDNPFSTAEFGFAEQEYTSTEKRVAWVDVPVGSTIESVIAKLATVPEATIYKILANHPILSDNQEYGINAGLTSKELIADKQAVRYPEGHAQAGVLILDAAGKPQYKATFFKSTAKADEDLRNADPADFYATAIMKAELANATQSITVQQDTL